MNNEKKRIEDFDILQSHVKKLESNHEMLDDQTQDTRKILDRVEKKFNEMYNELKSLSSIQIKDKDELSKNFVDVSQRMVAELTKATNKCEIIDSKVGTK